MTPKPKPEPQPQLEAVQLPPMYTLTPEPGRIKHLVVDGGEAYTYLYAVRTDDRLFVKKSTWPGGREAPWEEIETTTLFAQ